MRTWMFVYFVGLEFFSVYLGSSWMMINEHQHRVSVSTAGEYFFPRMSSVCLHHTTTHFWFPEAFKSLVNFHRQYNFMVQCWYAYSSCSLPQLRNVSCWLSNWYVSSGGHSGLLMWENLRTFTQFSFQQTFFYFVCCGVDRTRNPVQYQSKKFCSLN